MRGARTADNPAPHLLAALDQVRGVVVAQRRVADKSNEIPALPELLAPLDLDGALITADAMHTQVNTAEWIISRGAHYLLTVKDNQPGLHQTLKNLPWKDIPAISAPDGSHGRRVRRTLKVVQAPQWVDFPGAAQVTPDPAHPHHQQARRRQEEDHRGRLPGSAPCPWTRPAPSRSRPGPAATGPLRTASTGSGTWSRARTATNCAPATDHRSWPP